MKKALLIFAFASLQLILSAQSYNLFQPGKTHYFTSNKNLSVKIDSSQTAGNDVKHWLNRRSVPKLPPCVPSPTSEYGFDFDLEGFFGKLYIESQDGLRIFVGDNGDSLFLNPFAAVSSPWNFNTSGSLTAHVTQKVLATTFGQVDSIVTISISDGETIQLSKVFGYLSGPALAQYFGQPAIPCQLAFAPRAPKVLDYNKWQVGDQFTYKIANPNYFDGFHNHRVLSRTEFPASDSLVLITELRRVEFLNLTPFDTLFFPLAQDTLSFGPSQYGFLTQATSTVSPALENKLHYFDTWAFNQGRLENHYFQYGGSFADLDSNGFYSPQVYSPDGCFPTAHHYAEDLGIFFWKVNFNFTITSTIQNSRFLICYDGSLGSIPCPAQALLTSNAGESLQHAQLSFSATTNTLHFRDLAAGNYHLQVINMQGGLVYQSQNRLVGSGTLDLPLDDLAEGVYLLNLGTNSGQRLESIKFLKLKN